MPQYLFSVHSADGGGGPEDMTVECGQVPPPDVVVETSDLAVLRGVLRAYDPRWQTTRSGLELRMLDIVRDHGLPQPDVNVWLAGRWEADLLWTAARLIVEVPQADFQVSSRPTIGLTGIELQVLRVAVGGTAGDRVAEEVGEALVDAPALERTALRPHGERHRRARPLAPGGRRGSP